MIPVFHHCGLFTISNMEFLFSWVTNLYICNPPNSKIYLSNHNMEVHDTKNILIKCYPATNYLLWKHINKSPSAHLINLGSVSWKIPFETFCKVKLLFSSLVKPTFQKSLQLPLTEFLVTFGVETFGVWLKKVLPPRAPGSHLPLVAASVANRPPAQPYHRTWRRVREGEPQESFNRFLENEQGGKNNWYLNF